MSTEYRRGIPSTAHVEAATRLGLLWEDDDVGTMKARWRLEVHADAIRGDYATNNTLYTNWDPGPLIRAPDAHLAYRPIRPDGTPVDWEALDQEVARVGQPQTMACNLTASAQPQDFRADLWRRIGQHFSLVFDRAMNLSEIVNIDNIAIHARNWQWGWGTADREAPTRQNRTDILARWTVYQELKPLYDLVDGAQGEVAMPRDVVTEWARQARGGENIRPDWELVRTPEGLLGRTTDRQGGIVSWSDSENWLGQPLRNFATVLDAVAERRVVERMRGQTQAPTVTLPVDPSSPRIPSGTLCVQTPQGVCPAAAQPEQHRHNWIYDGLGGGHNGQYYHNCACGERDWFAEPMSAPSPREAVVRPATAQPEPRRFADVQPDRHGWRWWRQTGRDSTDLGQRFETQDGRCRWRSAHADAWFVPDTANPQMLRYTIIPTDEQGNPVSWEAIVPAGTVQSVNSDGTVTVALGDLRERGEPIRPGQFSNDFTASAPITAESFARALIQLDRGQNSVNAAQLHADTIRYCEQQISQAIIGIDTGHVTIRNSDGVGLHDSLKQQPLPRFTADELDDVDHSKTTKLDEVTLRRGKLPTVEQIAKYREVRAMRTGGTVADALKESRIDCEVAQYVLERWAGGLDNTAAHKLITWVVETTDVGLGLFVCSAEARAQQWIDHHSPTLDTSEKPSPTVQRERQEAEERRQRLAGLRQQLAAERAAQPQEMAKESEASRFALIEPDPQADPIASIRAWEARQAAAKVRPTAAPARPAAAPRRPAIEVVDAEVDGLSRVDVVTTLVGRAFNGRC